ncbi:DUF6233 domain-containing protein [Streptomyces sp. NPDC101237]|uniref:DUF6233 domain-containing protein n=1 Tax=Streptomyces sp. NPDC101237 TaxID=3366139 RepID=UPI0038055BF2
MRDLPSDAPRLRAILAHLERQIAETDTVGTYLRLQRDAVQAALSRTGRPAGPHPALAAPRQSPRQLQRSRPRPSSPPVAPVGLVIEEQRKDGHPTGGMIHTASCMPHMQLRPITPDVARQVLAKDATSFFTPCPLCRPDSELGIDVA